MKKVLLLFLFIIFSSCSQNEGGKQSLPSGAITLFDAENPSNTGTTPSPGCSVATWVNLVNTSQNGSVNCGSGGFAGTGIFTSPYRMEFDGTTSYVTTSINAQASTYPSMTWVAWINPSQLTFQHILSLDNHSGAYNRALVIQNSNWAVFRGTSSTFEATSADTNAWQHIAVVFTPTNITLYKNGTPYSLGAAPTINNTAQTFTIGKSAGGAYDFFNGSIALVTLYPRALTQQEITTSCNYYANRFDAVICN